MVVSLSASISGDKEVAALLRRLSPKKNPRPITRALVRSALKVQELSTTQFIIRGGRFRSGSGGLSDARVDAQRLTSRTGTLRRSIAVDRSLTPRAIDIGSELLYAAVHELGSRDGTTPARPFLQPALEKASSAFARFFAEELEKEINRR